MIRDVTRLADREFDVLVVGGGIYGLTIAYDAAQRGLAVALVDRGDFGAATSFNHLKTLHGGLRYLQSADVRRMRESIRERRSFARIAPRFVAPQAFAMPSGSSIARMAGALKVALALDALIARDRNRGLDPGHHLPAGHMVTGSKCAELFDGATPTVRSAAIWYDYVTTRSDRLTLAFARAAALHGAALANYVEAVAALPGKSVCGVNARDNLTGGTFDIRARILVNAAGPWAGRLFTRSGHQTSWPLLKAMNLVTARPSRSTAIVAPTRAGRGLILLPWMGRTLVGTSESHAERQPDDQGASRSEVNAFVSDVNDTFPSLRLRTEEVSLVHRGIVPACSVGGRLALLGHSRIVDHASSGSPEQLSVVGVKYTTARAVAERAVDLILNKLNRRPVTCRTASTVLPGAGLDESDSADPVADAIRDEMAQTLSDVVIRRTGLGATGYPGDASANDVATKMQQVLNWSTERTQTEIATLKKFYEIV